MVIIFSVNGKNAQLTTCSGVEIQCEISKNKFSVIACIFKKPYSETL